MFKKMLIVTAAVFLSCALVVPAGTAQELKLGYVDLRKAFYEYDKTKDLENKLNTLTEDRQTKRTKMIEVITKARDEAELLSGHD